MNIFQKTWWVLKTRSNFWADGKIRVFLKGSVQKWQEKENYSYKWKVAKIKHFDGYLCINNEKRIFLCSYRYTWTSNVFVIVTMPKTVHNLFKSKSVMHKGLSWLALIIILKIPVTAGSCQDALSCFVFESFFAVNKLVKTHDVSDLCWTRWHISTERFFILFIFEKQKNT